MALATSDMFSSFDVTDGAQTRDISPVLEDAIFYDLNLLGKFNPEMGRPADDTTIYWNEEVLNGDTLTTSASAASNATSLSVTAGHTAHIGDLLYDTATGSTEVMQVTNTATTALTITRAYISTTAATVASGATLALIRAEQESSNIGSDFTKNPTVRTNTTQIIPALDLMISGTQLARKMATNEYQDFLTRQLAARATELKINWCRAVLYAEKSASSGSDTVYRTMAGARNWIRDNSGIVDSASEATGYSDLNGNNKTSIDRGGKPNLLCIGTDLVGSISGIDSSVRRLRESDTTVGYTVQDILLSQGNMVEVLVDARVKTGDYFLLQTDKIAMRPYRDRGMFVIAAKDFTDGVKRRILSEWTLEFRNPSVHVYANTKT